MLTRSKCTWKRYTWTSAPLVGMWLELMNIWVRFRPHFPHTKRLWVSLSPLLEPCSYEIINTLFPNLSEDANRLAKALFLLCSADIPCYQGMSSAKFINGKQFPVSVGSLALQAQTFQRNSHLVLWLARLWLAGFFWTPSRSSARQSCLVTQSCSLAWGLSRD